MEHHSEAFVAFDTAKLRNAVAIADAGRNGEVRYLGEFDNTEAATRKLVAKLASKHARLTFCHEAGPTGYCSSGMNQTLKHRIFTTGSYAITIECELSKFSSQTGRARGYATAPAVIPKEAERGERLPS